MTTIRARTLTLLAVFAVLAACGDPLSDVERLSDVTVAEGADAASVAPGVADQAGAPLVLPSLFGSIFGADGSGVPVAEPVDDTAGDAVLVSSTTPAQSPGGFFSGLFGGGAPAAVPASASSAAPTIAPGTDVPYGVIATVCGIDPSSLGRAVASASGYTVYDTNPSSTSPRTQYITGFSDDCARQFFGSLALFGDIGTHELVRYSTAAGGAYTQSDRAYEAIKVAYCGVSERTPCGARLDALSARTTFLTVYETFGTDNGWADVLLSDGQVIADDF